MKRRTFLASSVAVTGGIVSGCTTETGSEERDTPSASTAPLEREVSLVEIDDITGHDIDIEVTQHSEQVDSDSTVRFTVTTTNTGRQRDIRISADDSCCLFNRHRGGSDPQGLWLYHADDIPSKRTEKKWTEDIPTDEPANRMWGDYGCNPEDYRHDESVSNEYELWDDYLVDEYFPTGTYRFEGDFTVWETYGAEDSEHTELEWGFSIEVTK